MRARVRRRVAGALRTRPLRSVALRPVDRRSNVVELGVDASDEPGLTAARPPPPELLGARPARTDRAVRRAPRPRPRPRNQRRTRSPTWRRARARLPATPTTPSAVGTRGSSRGPGRGTDRIRRAVGDRLARPEPVTGVGNGRAREPRRPQFGRQRPEPAAAAVPAYAQLGGGARSAAAGTRLRLLAGHPRQPSPVAVGQRIPPVGATLREDSRSRTLSASTSRWMVRSEHFEFRRQLRGGQL